MFQKWAKIWLNIPKNGKIEAELPRYHLSTGEKIEYKGQKLTNFQIKKKKRDFSGQKKQGWAKSWGEN